MKTKLNKDQIYHNEAWNTALLNNWIATNSGFIQKEIAEAC